MMGGGGYADEMAHAKSVMGQCVGVMCSAR